MYLAQQMVMSKTQDCKPWFAGTKGNCSLTNQKLSSQGRCVREGGAPQLMTRSHSNKPQLLNWGHLKSVPGHYVNESTRSIGPGKKIYDLWANQQEGLWICRMQNLSSVLLTSHHEREQGLHQLIYCTYFQCLQMVTDVSLKWRRKQRFLPRV